MAWRAEHQVGIGYPMPTIVLLLLVLCKQSENTEQFASWGFVVHVYVMKTGMLYEQDLMLQDIPILIVL